MDMWPSIFSFNTLCSYCYNTLFLPFFYLFVYIFTLIVPDFSRGASIGFVYNLMRVMELVL